MKKIIGILVLLITISAFAEEPASKITGAFGFKLGERLPDDARTHKCGNMLEYHFTPKKLFRKMDEYHVYIVPGTRQIYRILATGKIKEKLVAVQEFNTICSLIGKKYKLKPETSAKREDYKLKLYQSGHQAISVILSTVSKNINGKKIYIVTIFYSDDMLYHSANEKTIKKITGINYCKIR